VTQVLTGVNVNLNKAIDAQASPEVRARLSSASLGQPRLDSGRRRFIVPINLTVADAGNVKGTLAGYFGHDAVVLVGFYTLEQEADRFAPVSDAIINSFHFAPAADYDPSANASPFWSNVARMALTGALIGLLVGLVGYLAARSKRTKTR
jgi:hypothetical protein